MHPYIKQAQRRGAGHLRPPVDGAGAAKDVGSAAVSGAAHAAGGGLRRLLRRRGRPVAPRDGVQAVHREDATAAGPVLRRHARAGTASPARWPTGSTRSWRPSPTSASRKAIRCPSPRWCSTRRGSSCTIPPRSARRCCGRSRWVSTRRSRWWPMPVGTGSSCTGPTSTPAWRTPRWRTRATRCGWVSAASVTSATSWPSGSSRSERPTGRSPLCSI